MLSFTTPAGVAVDVYDSIHEVPAKRFTDFNAAALDHSAVGSDMQAATEHLGRLQMFLNGNDVDAAKGEFNNYVLCLNQATNTGTLLLATVVHRIGGEVVTAPADGKYQGIANRLDAAGITQQQVEEACEAVRGKFQRR